MLNVLASWLGLHLPASATPNERAAALSAETPEAAAPIHEIAALYVRERFSPPLARADATRDASAQARAAWQAARPPLSRRVLRRFLRRRSRTETPRRAPQEGSQPEALQPPQAFV
jgi:hypothetical protein